jgi:hypothetical protein
VFRVQRLGAFVKPGKKHQAKNTKQEITPNKKQGTPLESLNPRLTDLINVVSKSRWSVGQV